MTPLEIANEALHKIKQNGITSFPAAGDTSAPKAALACSEFLVPAINRVLMQYDWRCAEKHQTLTASVTLPIAGYSYCWDLPTDFLKFRALSDSLGGELTDFRYSGKVIFTNTFPVVLCYTYPILDDFDEIPNHIGEVAALVLAESLAPYLEGERPQNFPSMMRTSLVNAKRIDSTQGPSLNYIDENNITWLRSHGY